MKVCGIEHCKFTNKQGEVIEYDRLTLLYDISPERGDGQAAEVVTAGTDKTSGLQVGDDVEILYNKYGKVRRIDYVN